ncbi:hypothetical protein NKH18_12670 [Streptomyces sp. M10(2022)]
MMKLRDVQERTKHAVDWAGAVLLCAGLFLATYALMRGQAEGWTSTKILASLIAAFLLLGCSSGGSSLPKLP